MALNTAISFLFLGIGLIATAGPDALPLRLLAGASIRARLLRAFLPFTVAIVLVGSVAVVIAWRGPLIRNVDLLDPRGAVAWAVVFVALGLWELAALLMQPSFITDSWEHPTLSTLMDSVLGSHPARSISIFVWLLVGGSLIRR